MGFLKKERAPDELPGLAMSGINNFNTNKTCEPSSLATDVKNIITPIHSETTTVKTDNLQTSNLPKSEVNIPKFTEAPIITHQDIKHHEHPTHHEEKNTKIQGEDYLEFSNRNYNKIDTEEIRSKIDEHINGNGNEKSKFKYFDKVLDDINDGIEDLGKMEDWYENKFSSEDIVSNMRGYWEGNKADIIIQSFGTQYRKKINDNVKDLQKLEEDWRAIYFQLIKKEEEMKKIEQELKSTLAEFVDLCKRRNHEKKDKENKKENKD